MVSLILKTKCYQGVGNQILALFNFEYKKQRKSNLSVQLTLSIMYQKNASSFGGYVIAWVLSMPSLNFQYLADLRYGVLVGIKLHDIIANACVFVLKINRDNAIRFIFHGRVFAQNRGQ